MAAIGADEETQQWWKLTDPMQESFNEDATGSGGPVPWWTVSVLVSETMSDCVLNRPLGFGGSVPL